MLKPISKKRGRIFCKISLFEKKNIKKIIRNKNLMFKNKIRIERKKQVYVNIHGQPSIGGSEIVFDAS